ncbi:MAG: hypothetical protein M1289_02115 [Patescibacteria group bacterium]|nr:hypothetical protein [Patescibacteria group bacterium]
MNPAKETFGNTKEDMEIWGINTVNKYKIKALVTKENNPKVKRLKGRLIILRIGLRKNDKKDKAAPPIAKVSIPPLILTPDKTCEVAKRAKALTEDLATKDFITSHMLTNNKMSVNDSGRIRRR